MNGANYIKVVTDCIEKAWSTQKDTIVAAADLVAEAIEKKNNVFVFGCSHAGILAEEVFYRTGGLAVINPIFFPGFMLNTRPITMTSSLERIPGLGKTILSKNNVKADDVLILHSVSGRNTVPVEMAIEAKAMGVRTICITNLDYSNGVTSRHPSGKRLFEVCDIVIDNCGRIGDSAMDVGSITCSPTSTVIGAAIMQAIVCSTVDELLRRGAAPEVFCSSNVEGGDAINQVYIDKYRKEIPIL